jgi:two-component system, OmpR family, KDP operon response regulator KdpE
MKEVRMAKRGARILVVDDEIEIVRALRRGLLTQDYQVVTAQSGEEALSALFEQRPDLVLLDLALPNLSGIEVCQRIRKTSNIPIIVISAKDTEREKVQALELGADDYITKPFGMKEVVARIRVALRHVAQSQSGTSPLLKLGALQIDFAARRVQVNNQEIQLTVIEYDLLKLFVTERGKVLTRQMILDRIWGAEALNRGHSLHVHVAQLRRKLEVGPDRPRFIFTILGIGYRFNDPEDEAANTARE